MNNSITEELGECVYSNKLLSAIDKLNKINKDQINIEIVKRAISYARYYHANQKRLSGEPFYSHPLTVAYMVLDYSTLYRCSSNMLIT